MAFASQKYKKNVFFIDENMHPHLIEVIKTKCNAIDIDYIIDDIKNINETQLKKSLSNVMN